MTGAQNDMVSRLNEQLQVLQLQLEDECQRRRAAESNWSSAEQRIDEIEALVRQECWAAFEAQSAKDRERYRAIWEAEQLRGEEHLDAKMDAFKGIYEDDDATYANEATDVDGSNTVLAERTANAGPIYAERVRELENHVVELELRLANSEREKGLRTPSRKVKSFKSKPWVMDDAIEGIENVRVGDGSD